MWCRLRDGSSSLEAALQVKSKQLAETKELLRASREECSAMEAELKGKSAELVQTTELLRASRAEEHVRSRSSEHEARRRAEDEGRGAVEEELRALKRKYVQLLETCESTLRALSPRWSAQPHQPHQPPQPQQQPQQQPRAADYVFSEACTAARAAAAPAHASAGGGSSGGTRAAKGGGGGRPAGAGLSSGGLSRGDRRPIVPRVSGDMPVAGHLHERCTLA